MKRYIDFNTLQRAKTKFDWTQKFIKGYSLSVKRVVKIECPPNVEARLSQIVGACGKERRFETGHFVLEDCFKCKLQPLENPVEDLIAATINAK